MILCRFANVLNRASKGIGVEILRSQMENFPRLCQTGTAMTSRTLDRSIMPRFRIMDSAVRRAAANDIPMDYRQVLAATLYFTDSMQMNWG